jgi:tryptophanyl-tRNA synthetase
MPTAARIMSLRDGTKKMSKSDESDYSRINLTDDADTIALKFRKAKSDATPGISYDETARPEVANLIQIYAALSNTTPHAVVTEYASSNFSEFKTALTDLAVARLSPITARMRELMADQAQLDAILQNGTERAAAIAEPILKTTMAKIGLLSR